MQIFVTRFNTETFKEYSTWREKNQYMTCIYNSPMKITDKLYLNELVFVLEMNNSENKIVGIGRLKNRIILDKKYNIYSDNNYNRYTYIGAYRLLRKDLSNDEKKILRILDTLLFTGSRHMKRGHGIQSISPWIEYNRYINFVEFLTNLFTAHFTNKNPEDKQIKPKPHKRKLVIKPDQ
jgi:hypothetical protein